MSATFVVGSVLVVGGATFVVSSALVMRGVSFVFAASSFNLHSRHYNIDKENIIDFCRRKIYYAKEEQKFLNAIRNLSTQTSWTDKYTDISG
jgi:hypothetical protein